MQLFSIKIILFLGVSLDVASSSVHSNFLKQIPDGFDAVQKISYHASVSHGGLQDVEEESWDFYQRKASRKGAFFYHVKNVKTLKTIDDKELAALKVPLLIDLHNKTPAYYMNEAETMESTKTKLWSGAALKTALEIGKKVLHLRMNFDVKEKHRINTLFGICKVSTSEPISNGTFTLELSTTRNRCEDKGAVRDRDRGMLKRVLAKYDADDIDEESLMSVKIQYDETTHQVMNFSMEVKGKLMGERKLPFVTGFAVHFVGFEETQEVFDESKNTEHVDMTSLAIAMLMEEQSEFTFKYELI